jgi:hypothetical protein
MTPSEIETTARRRLNAESDTFWSSEEIIRYIWACEVELATRALTVRKTDTSLTSVVDQEEYTIPSGVIRLKRVTYAGSKLSPIDEAQNDSITINNPSSSVTGTPQFYRQWATTLSLEPIPSVASDEIKLWYYGLPDVTTSTSTLDTPAEYHIQIANFGVPALMASKEVGDTRTRGLQEMWEKKVTEIIGIEKKRRRGDRFARVKREEDLEITNLGPV